MPITAQVFEQRYRDLQIPEFSSKVADKSLTKSLPQLQTMQVNLGYACNLACAHCFVDAGPEREEMMSRQVMEDALAVFAQNDFKTMDITGGAPELNENLQWFIEQAAQLGEVMVRTNAAILTKPKYQHLIDVYRDNKVTVICSLPCYTKANVDSQRGEGTFERALAGLKALNAVGYGSDSELVLNLVYNPLSGYLPGPQEGLQKDYGEQLATHGIVFNELFCLANTPMGRFRDTLEAEGTLDDYLKLVYDNFNPATIEGIMCRNQIDVDYDGTIYDCEMYHVIGLPIDSPYQTVDVLKDHRLPQRDIRLTGACYVCTAGSGSSCGGSLV